MLIYYSTRKYAVAISLAMLLITAISLSGCNNSGEQAGSQAVVTTPTAPLVSPSVGTPTVSDSAVSETDQADAARQHSMQGGMALESRDYDKAIAEYTLAIQAGPSNTEYYLMRATAYRGKGDTDKALADYQQVVRLEGGSTGVPSSAELASAYYNMGEIFFKKSAYELAIKNYTMATNLGINIPELYEHRGDAYKALKQPDKAIADYKNELEQDGKSTESGTYHLTEEDRQRLQQKIKELSGTT